MPVPIHTVVAVQPAAGSDALTGVVDLTVYGPIGILAMFAVAAATYMFRILSTERAGHAKAILEIVEAHKDDVTSLSKAHAENMLALGERHRAEFANQAEEHHVELQQLVDRHRTELQAMVDRQIATASAHVAQYHALADKISTVLDSLSRRVDPRRPR